MSEVGGACPFIAQILVHNCEDHFHLYSLPTVHIQCMCDLYQIHIISDIIKLAIYNTRCKVWTPFSFVEVLHQVYKPAVEFDFSQILSFFSPEFLVNNFKDERFDIAGKTSAYQRHTAHKCWLWCHDSIAVHSGYDHLV